MTLDATVLKVYNDRLLVRDFSNNQEIIVHSPDARRFSPGDTVRIFYNGQMTFSIPPQITAISIQKNQCPIAPPQSNASQLRATVLQRGCNSLLVREIGTNKLFIVDCQNFCRFSVGQRIIIQYETIFLNVPPDPSRIVATNITPMC